MNGKNTDKTRTDLHFADIIFKEVFHRIPFLYYLCIKQLTDITYGHNQRRVRRKQLTGRHVPPDSSSGICLYRALQRGKSSLINMLTKNPKLAMTSATPGKTLLINHFLINKEWYLVDLPGYGYAQRGKR